MKTKPFKLNPRNKDTHKGDYGHVLVLAGSLGLTGAAYLSCQGALLSGSGLVTLGIPKSLNPIMEVKLTEAMTIPLAETTQKTLSVRALTQIKKILPSIDALAIGPGLSTHKQTQRLIHLLLRHLRVPFVIDADGLNALSGKMDLLKRLKTRAVITPHPGEMSRLLGISVSQIQKNRIKIAKNIAKKYNVVVALKGHQSVVANPFGKFYINHTGNPGMASGGCGDVLTGIIAALLGQGIEPYQASKLAVYIHGCAADLAAAQKGQISLLATDTLEALPNAFQKYC